MTPEFLEKFKKDPTIVLNGSLLPPPAKPSPTANPKSGFTGLKHKGIGGGPGMLPRYTSPEAMNFVIEEYFTKCELSDGAIKPTVAGLVLALGYANESSFKKYKERGDGFAFVVDRAYTRMEDIKNQLLLRGGPTTESAKFDLKNKHGWADKSDTTITHVPGGSLAELVQALQGKVLRPALLQPNDVIEDGEFEEETEDTEELPVKLTRRAKEDDWFQDLYDELAAEETTEKQKDELDYDI